MKADLVHSLLAASMVKPSLLAVWHEAPGALSRFDVQPEEFDLAALRRFAGLAFKVKHNALRGPYANTFRLLNLSGLEIEMFAEYACACSAQGVELAKNNEERARLLLQFIGKWHRPDLPVHALIWDMARHEQAVNELDASTEGRSEVPARQDAHSPMNLDSKVCRRGGMRFHELRHHPLEILAAMSVPTPDLTAFEMDTHLLAYWRAPDSSSVQLVELDEFGFVILQSADGSHSLRELATLVGIGRPQWPYMVELARQLVQAGLLFNQTRA